MQHWPEKHPKRSQRKTLETRVNIGCSSVFSNLQKAPETIRNPMLYPFELRARMRPPV
jgi:hypothetical protein